MSEQELDLDGLGTFVAGASGAKRYRILLVNQTAGLTAAALEKNPGYAGQGVVVSADVQDGGGKAELSLASKRDEITKKVDEAGANAKFASFVLGFPGAGNEGVKATVKGVDGTTRNMVVELTY